VIDLDGQLPAVEILDRLNVRGSIMALIHYAEDYTTVLECGYVSFIDGLSSRLGAGECRSASTLGANREIRIGHASA